MSLTDPDLQQRVERYEAGVSDLIAAYELAEQHYFAAVDTSTPASRRNSRVELLVLDFRCRLGVNSSTS